MNKTALRRINFMSLMLIRSVNEVLMLMKLIQPLNKISIFKERNDVSLKLFLHLNADIYHNSCGTANTGQGNLP